MTRQERELSKIDKRWEYLLKTYGGRPMQELLERLDNSLKENAALQAENERLEKAVELLSKSAPLSWVQTEDSESAVKWEMEVYEFLNRR